MKIYGRMEVQLYVFVTLALDGPGWTPKPVWTQWQGENIPAPDGNQALVVQPSHYAYLTTMTLKFYFILKM
jgi:hypothetical protein